MADEEQKQTAVSDEQPTLSNEITESSEINPEKTENVEQSTNFVYTDATASSEVTHDILQQALDEAGNDIGNTNNIVDVHVNNVNDNGDHVNLLSTQEESVNTVSEAQSLLNTLTGETVQESADSGITSNNDNSSADINEGITVVPVSNGNEEISKIGTSDTHDNQSNLKITKQVKPSPLGSSQNPIHIVQQGNTYHSSQDLSKDQLQQIAQVLHKQQIVQALKNGGSSVVYNPDTNTKIVYRVVTPAEALEKNVNFVPRPAGVSILKNSSSAAATSTPVVKRGRGRPRKDGTIGPVTPASASRGRGRGRRPRSDDLDISKELVTLSKEELESRKKQRPRTRYGRISKPPSFMVKEYKRIHPLDYNEEDDDVDEKSDGGYSDYNVSENEAGKDLSDVPNDSKLDDDDDETVSSKQTQHKKTKHRGRPPLSEAEKSNKRKFKLQEAMNGCTSSEVIDVLFPHIINEVPVWDYILQKASGNSRIDICELYKIFEEIFANIQKCLVNNLQEISSDENDIQNAITFSNPNISSLFGVGEGRYTVINQDIIENFASQSTKRLREESFEHSFSEKRLKLDWSGTLNLASGVDLSISEIQPGQSIKVNNFDKSDSILHSKDIADVSIAPVSTNNVQHITESNENDKDINSSSVVANLNSAKEAENSNQITTNNIPVVENMQDENSEIKEDDADSNQEESIERIRAAINDQESNNGVQMVQLVQQSTIPENSQTESVAESVDGQTVALLMDSKDPTQEYVAPDQTVVGVIEQPQEAEQEATATVTPENLLGYLGEQLSAEALQPGNIVIIQNPDGTTTTVALSGAEGKEIPMETVQALLAMDPSAQQQIE